MVEQQENIDAFFREKLTGHKENPSPGAWEKLDGRLSKKRRRATYWRVIAASFLLLMGIGSFIWLSIRSTEDQLKNVAHTEGSTDITKKENPDNEPILEEPIALIKETIPPIILEPKTDLISNRPLLNVDPEKDAEEATTEAGGIVKKILLPIEVGDIELPPLHSERPLAKKGLVEQELRTVSYTVKIISNGISEQPEKETLVEEIGEKIERIGGLLNKVDRGFSDLQDAKNSLFASLITIKSNNKN